MNHSGRTQNKSNRNNNPGRGSHGQQQKQSSSSSRGAGRGGSGGRKSGRGVGRGRGRGETKPTTFKRSGEKGAESHTVSEAVRIRFTKLMLDLRENESVDKIEMPTDLSNTERKFLHELASQLGLKSKSTGKGEDRRITITKIGQNNEGSGNGDSDLEADDLKLPVLNMGSLAVNALSWYVNHFPPTEFEEAEAIETGSSLWKKNASTSDSKSNRDNDDGKNDQCLLNTLKQLKIETDKRSPSRKKAKPKQFHLTEDNLKKRQAIHNALQRARMQNPNYAQMQKLRSKLPAFANQKDICDIIRKNTGMFFVFSNLSN